jgi:type IV secretory pathway component VirB8
MDAQTFADHARPIHSDDRELQFKEVLSFHASEKVLQRRFNRAGWIVGTIGAVLGLAGVGAVVILLPLKQTVVKWIEVDTSTGWVGEVAGAADAPRMFNARVADHFLRQYIRAECPVPTMAYLNRLDRLPHYADGPAP